MAKNEAVMKSISPLHHFVGPVRPTLGVLIRFSNSAATLPAVLEGLRKQTIQPDVILGVASQSSDASTALILAEGGRVIEWNHAYSHPKTLNFGIAHLQTDLILVLSSHTVLEDPTAIERMRHAMSHPQVSCVSGKWDDDPFYSDAIDWCELQDKGLKFGSIYSNSMGMLRRSHWVGHPFDETLDTAEDYDWAVRQLRRGHLCRRLDFAFSHRRAAGDRSQEFAQAAFALAGRQKLTVAWLGPCATLQEIGPFRQKGEPEKKHVEILRAWAGHELGASIQRLAGCAAMTAIV